MSIRQTNCSSIARRTGIRALDNAHQEQTAGIAALTSAWELFLDIRRLIELIYRQQQLAQRVIEQTDDKPQLAAQLIGPLDNTQQDGLTRCERLGKLLETEKDQLPEAESPDTVTPNSNNSTQNGPNPDDEGQQQQLAMRRQQLEVAEQLLEQVVADVKQVRELLRAAAAIHPPDKAVLEAEAEPAAKSETPPAGPALEKADPSAAQAELGTQAPPPTPQDDQQMPAGPLREVGVAVDRSIKTLEELRRLFFSLVEHLRDTAEQQANVNDATTQLAADPATAQQPEKSGPLAHRQQQLQSLAQQIAEALRAQGEQAAAAADQQAPATPAQGGNQQQNSAQTAEKLQQASQFVDTAQQAMQTAAEELQKLSQGQADQEKPLAAAQEQQATSLDNLLQALALLDENQPQNQQSQGQDQQQQQQHSRISRISSSSNNSK